MATRPVPPFTRRAVKVLVPPWLVGVEPSKARVPLSVRVTVRLARTTNPVADKLFVASGLLNLS